jgi:hypothetical protein
MVDQVVHTGSAMPLYGFCVSTVAAVSIMGGVYAILPAYEADLFGAKYVGAIHGKMLLYSAAAALVGELITFGLTELLCNCAPPQVPTCSLICAPCLRKTSSPI